jgi:superfamily II RNA helicase
VISMVEAILENPGVLLEAQTDKARGDLIAKLKAEGVEYEQRMAELDKVSYPKPNAELIYETFDAYAAHHPWLGSENIRPKSIARDMIEQYLSFNDYVKEYGVNRAEGVLLRYLSEAYKTLVQTVPDAMWDDALIDAVGFMRQALSRVDSSLVQEWERMLAPEAAEAQPDAAATERSRAAELLRDPRMLRSRIRSELHLLVKALAARDYDAAAECVRSDVDDPFTAERLEQAMAPFFERHGELIADHRARQTQWTVLDAEPGGRYRARQVLLDPSEDNAFYLEARIDPHDGSALDGPLLELVHVGE